MSRKQINLKEYSSGSVATYRAPLNLIHTGTTHISTLRLAIGMARTILTNPSNYIFQLYQTGSSLIFLKYVLDANNDLRLIDGARNIFRDFSRSTRIGEMAQGISFLIVIDHLRFPVFLDFKDYLSSQGYPTPANDESTPDFVMYDPLSSDIFVAEVKGRWPDVLDLVKLKSKFNEALGQCNQVHSYFLRHGLPDPTRGKYAFVVDFFEKSSPWGTSFNLADPDVPPTGKVEKPLSLIKRHYVSWFLIAGLVTHAKRLYQGEELGAPPKIKRNVNGEDFYILDHSESELDLQLRLFNKKGYLYGISVNVWNMLNQKVINSLNYLSFQPRDEQGINLFSDGTLLIVE